MTLLSRKPGRTRNGPRSRLHRPKTGRAAQSQDTNTTSAITDAEGEHLNTPKHTPSIRTSAPIAIAALIAAATATTTSALAQDSVSASGGLPGDALDPFVTGANSHQLRRYAVDLVTVQSSWGNRYAVGPIAKAPKAATNTNFDHLIGAQALSTLFAQGPLAPSTFQLWNESGKGTHPTANTTPTSSVSTININNAQQAGWAFMAFDAGPNEIFGTPDDSNVIIAGTAAFTFRQPNRLLVERVNALSSKATNAAGSSSTASFGLGGVDTDGSVVVLADGFGQFAPGTLQNKTVLKIESALRNPASVNRITSAGATDAAATSILYTTNTTLVTPTLIPSLASGGNAVTLLTDFTSALLVESSPQVITPTASHLPAGIGATRGGVSLTPHNAPATLGNATDAAIAALLLRTDADTTTRAIRVFSLNSTGAPTDALTATLPTTPGVLIDPTDNFDPAAAFSPIAQHEFTHYQSQVSFRGGNGPAAVAVIPNTTTPSNPTVIAAAAVTPAHNAGATPTSEDNYIAVFNLTTGATPIVAAHSGGPSGSGIPGKAIRSGLNGPTIGRIVPRSVAFPGQPQGPSISAPAIDLAGNLYFLATVELTTPAPTTHANALIRANRTSAGNYQLELLLAEGQTITGANSATEYRIDFLGLADGDSIDSGALWSGNIAQDLVSGVSLQNALTTASPASLGMLAVRARLLYDNDNSGTFNDPSGNAASTEPDQAYNVILAVMPSFPPADVDRDGQVTISDYFTFLTRFFSFDIDYDGDGDTTISDYFTFLTDFFANL